MKKFLPFACLLIIFLLSVLLPLSWIEGVPLCVVRSITGFDCPGCGLTRAFHALFHGHWRLAIEYNALSPVLLLWLLIYLADHLVNLVQGQRPCWYTQQGSKVITISFGVLFFGQWIFKILLNIF